MKYSRIRLKVLLPLAAATVVFVSLGLLAISRDRDARVEESGRAALRAANDLYHHQLEHDAETMTAMFEVLDCDVRLRELYLSGDRDALLNYVQPIFERLRSKFGVTHFYFHDANRVNFFRVHKPSKYGDFIDRFTMTKAAETGTRASGIELGPFGTFTLRVVSPWRDGDRLIGYIELGKEVEHITPLVREARNVEIFVRIEKRFLDRKGWEEGLKAFGKTGDWDEFEDAVIIDRATTMPSDQVKPLLQKLDRHGEEPRLEFEYNGKLYVAGCAPLADAGGRTLGDIVVLYDATSLIAELDSGARVKSAAVLTAGFALMVFFYFLLGWVERSIDKKAEVLRRSEERFRNIAEMTDEWIWEGNTDGLYTFASPSAQRIIGYTPKEIIGKKHVYDLVPADQREEAKRIVTETNLYHKPLVRLRGQLVHKDGHIVFVEINARPVLDSRGALIGYRGAFRDVTERIQAEEKLRQASDSRQMLLNCSATAIFTVDGDKRITSVNDAFCKVTGFTEEETVGKSCTMLRGEPCMTKCGLYDPQRTEPIFRKQCYITTKDGRRLTILKNAITVRDEAGAVVGGVESFIDVTELTQAREAAESARSELEAKISELQESRRAVLNMMQDMEETNCVLKETQTQLIQQEKMSSMGTLAAGVAHEFNNILAGIMGFASLAEAEPARVPKLAEIVLRESERAAKITRSLLSFAKRKEQSLAPADLRTLLDEVVTLTRRDFEKVNIKIKTDYSDVPPIMAETSQMEQVFLNIFINARHAMEHGGTLFVKVGREGDEIAVSISDTGHGIPKENLNKIFDPFFSTKGVWGRAQQSGTGLGLSVSRNIIEAHGGRIDVTSEVGKGTTFAIRLPAARNDHNTPSEQITRKRKERQDMNHAYKVLVADDEEVLRDLFREILMSLGHEATVVSNGEAALEELQKAQYDYIFLDMMMPGRYDGKAVLEKIKEAGLNVKVMICTGKLEDDNLAATVKQADGYIRKPVTVGDIKDALSGAENLVESADSKTP